ncbi:hypothetical protein LBMAG53_09620 [Planctomycetota bacterium]|nr:hypothetical protein LBMAG53_09620 [Planctomycetota bacterium]
MLIRTVFFIAVAVLATAPLATAGEGDHGGVKAERPGHGGEFGEHHRKHLKGVLFRLHLLMLDKFDADGDGKLDDAERKTARQWFEERRQQWQDKHGRREGGDNEAAFTDDGERAALRGLLDGRNDGPGRDGPGQDGPGRDHGRRR